MCGFGGKGERSVGYERGFGCRPRYMCECRGRRSLAVKEASVEEEEGEKAPNDPESDDDQGKLVVSQFSDIVVGTSSHLRDHDRCDQKTD